VSGISDTAARAAIGAAARELKLPTVRDHAARLAEIAARQRHTHLAYLAEVLAAELDDRTERRRARRIAEARFPRLKRLADGPSRQSFSSRCTCSCFRAPSPRRCWISQDGRDRSTS